MLSLHPSAALEYWFFKVNAGPVALLVDWIVRRRLGEHVLRVSVHAPGRRAVSFERLPAPVIDGQNFFTPQRTAGQLGEIAWALDIDRGPDRIDPDIFPARLLRLTDLALVSAPAAAFSGWVRVGPRQFELQRAPGMLSHYWGRHLPSEWWWVSANQFDHEGVAVECSVFRSGVWGLPVRLPLAYLYLRCGGLRRLVMAPPARAQVAGTPESFEIRFRPIGAPEITLKARGRDYGDLGEGIVNTLTGDLELWEGSQLLARSDGAAGLERRRPQRHIAAK